MAQSLAQQVDTDLLAEYANAGTTVAGGATIDDADVLAVVTAFDNAMVPTTGRHGIVGVNTKADLLGINKYNAYDQTGKTGTAVQGNLDNFLGTVYGMDLHMSQNVPTSTTGRNLFFHTKGISLAEQQKPRFEMEYSVDQIAWKTVLHTIYGVGTERASAVVELTRTTAP